MVNLKVARGRMVPSGKADRLALQRSRIEQIVLQMNPNWAIQFLADGGRIRFRIIDHVGGQVLARHCAAWRPTEIALRSDQELKVVILVALAGMIF